MFRDIIGHQKTLAMLEHDYEHNRLSHAYLFSGPKHIGKSTIVRQFADILQGNQNNHHSDITIIDELPLENKKEQKPQPSI